MLPFKGFLSHINHFFVLLYILKNFSEERNIFNSYIKNKKEDLFKRKN